MNIIHQQIVNCSALMAGLAALPDSLYYHGLFTNEARLDCNTQHCAGGWAAAWNIGGLYLDPLGSPRLPMVKFSIDVLDSVFGDGSLERIFMCSLGRVHWKRADVLRAISEHMIDLSKRIQ